MAICLLVFFLVHPQFCYPSSFFIAETERSLLLVLTARPPKLADQQQLEAEQKSPRPGWTAEQSPTNASSQPQLSPRESPTNRNNSLPLSSGPNSSPTNAAN